VNHGCTKEGIKISKWYPSGARLATLHSFLDRLQMQGFTSMNQSDGVLSPQYKAPVLSENGAIGIRNLRPKNRFEATEFSSLGSRDEALIVDERLGLRPAQVVESKLTRLLQDASLPVSHLQMRGLLRTR
jgi:hypothetical protein